MSKFENGVRWYTTGEMRLNVHFPEDEVCCKYCKFLRTDANNERFKCSVTNEILYSTKFLGNECPIEFKNEKGDDEQ